VLRAPVLAALSNPVPAMGISGLLVPVSDNTMSPYDRTLEGAGYEHIHYPNPNNPLTPDSFLEGRDIAGAVNNTNYPADRFLQTMWVDASTRSHHLRTLPAPTIKNGSTVNPPWRQVPTLRAKSGTSRVSSARG